VSARSSCPRDNKMRDRAFICRGDPWDALRSPLLTITFRSRFTLNKQPHCLKTHKSMFL